MRGPREDDPGYARDLAVQARVAVHKRGSQWTVERKGKAIHATDSVRGVVTFLRDLLEQ